VLIKESKKGNSFNLPGGGVDFIERGKTETFIQSAIREAEEESGQEVVIDGFMGIDHILDERKIHITLAATAIGGFLRASNGHPEVIAVTFNEIEQLHKAGRLRSERVLQRAHQYFKGFIYDLKLLQTMEKDVFPIN